MRPGATPAARRDRVKPSFEVHGVLAAAAGNEYFCGIGLGLEKPRQFLPHLVAFHLDGRAEEKIAAGEISVQAGDQPVFDPLLQAAPADMDDAAAAALVVEKKQGQAIGGLDHRRRPRPLQDQSRRPRLPAASPPGRG